VAGEEHSVEAPLSLSVTPQGDGQVLVQWAASESEQDSGVDRYELFQRLSHLRDWGKAVASVKASGLVDYNWTGSGYNEALLFDFGIRAVHASGVSSTITVHENVNLTGPRPDAPEAGSWQIRIVPGVMVISVLDPTDGVTSYNVYHFTDKGLEQAGSFKPGDEFYYHVPDPLSRKPSLLSISAVNRWGEGGRSLLKVKLNEPINGGDLVPGVPGFTSDGGTYPLVNRLALGPYQSFSITLKLEPADLYADFVGFYEFERQDNAGEGDSWSDWKRLTEHQLKLQDSQSPLSPKALYYEDTDRTLKPEVSYRYRARAVSRWGKPVPRAGCEPLGKARGMVRLYRSAAHRRYHRP
jgi:hypothetical protein